ncbi:MAG: rod shape-determining protein RodA [Phycisphaeraceae bacterium]
MIPLPERLRMLLKPNPGWYALFAALALAWIGIEAIDTVAPEEAAKTARFWLPVALIVMAVCTTPRPRWIGHVSYPLFIAVLIVLAIMALPFMPRSIVPVRNGARAWISLGSITLQPSELMKVAFVLSMAWYLRYRSSYRTLRGLLIPFFIMFIPVALILKQPDLGTALLFAPSLFFMLVAAGAKLRHLGLLLALVVATIVINVAIALWAPDSMQILRPHQRARIVSMVSLAQGDTRYIKTSAYQQDKAMTLVSAGGLTGYGKERSATIVKFNRVPHVHNDMIFAVIANRWGLLGVYVVLGLYFVLISSMLLTAARSKDPLAQLSCVGFAGMIFTQAAINIGMNLGILPVTGITLPLISYGGSSLVATFAMIGLTLNFASRRPAMLARPSFEFDNPDAIFQ